MRNYPWGLFPVSGMFIYSRGIFGGMSEQNTLETTETSLSVLETVVGHGPATLSELAENTGLATSTLYTHLRTLIETEYVVRKGRRYEPGIKLFHLGELTRHRDDRYELARRVVSDLASGVNEEVNFSIEEYGRSFVLFEEVPARTGDGYQAGRHFHMHSSASGKAMLAEYPEKRVREVVDRWGMPAFTDRTITDYDALLTELETVREQGYAVSDQEELDGLQAVAVVVNSPDGSVFGTLDISGPPYRLSEPDEVASQLRPSVESLESELRATYPSGDHGG